MSARSSQLRSLFEAHHEIPEDVDEMTKQLHLQRGARAGVAIALFVVMVVGLFLAGHFLGAASILP